MPTPLNVARARASRLATEAAAPRPTTRLAFTSETGVQRPSYTLAQFEAAHRRRSKILDTLPDEMGCCWECDLGSEHADILRDANRIIDTYNRELSAQVAS